MIGISVAVLLTFITFILGATLGYAAARSVYRDEEFDLIYDKMERLEQLQRRVDVLRESIDSARRMLDEKQRR